MSGRRKNMEEAQGGKGALGRHGQMKRLGFLLNQIKVNISKKAMRII
jgi:hypothetical protein